jgi:hypothetical protein
MRSEEQIRERLKVREKEAADYHRLTVKDLSIGAFAAYVMERQLNQKIEELKWVLSG